MREQVCDDCNELFEVLFEFGEENLCEFCLEEREEAIKESNHQESE